MSLLISRKLNILEIVLIVTPSLVMPFLLEGFELPKTLFVTVLLAFGLRKFKHIEVTKSPKNLLSHFNLIFFVYLGVYIVSAVFATDPGTSLLGYYGRFAGSLIFISVLILFLVNSRQQILKLDFRTMLGVISIGSLIPVLYSYIQIFTRISLVETSTRIFSTFGQPNWFGGYLVIILLIHAISYFKDKRNVSLFYFVFTLIPLFYTLSISSFFTLLFCFCTFLFMPIGKNDKIRIYVLILFFVLTSVLHGSDLYSRATHQVMAAAESQASVLTNDTGFIRGVLAKSSLSQIINSPKLLIIGAGPENFAYDFKRPSILNETSEWSFLYNKPHNFYIEEFFETGILGLGFFVVCTIFLLKKLKGNIYAIFPLAILFNSIFGWFTAYLFVIFFVTLAKVLLDEGFHERYIRLKFKINFKSFLIYDLLFVFALISAFSFSIVKFKPCLSFTIFSYYQNFALDCANGNLNLVDAERIIEINPKNRLVKESVALDLMNSYPKKSEELLLSLNEWDSTNPIYHYYLGLLFEKEGLKEKAFNEYTTSLYLQPRFIQAKTRLLYLK